MPKIVNHEERRQEIASATARLISEQGLDNVTIQDIAAQCGYTQGMVLHYYKNKSELICSALDWCDRNYQMRCETATVGLSGLRAAEARLKAALPLDEKIKSEWSIAIQLWSRIPYETAIADYFSRRRWDLQAILLEDLANARTLGQVRPDLDEDISAKALIAGITGIGVNFLFHPQHFPPQQQLLLLEYSLAPLRKT